MTELYCVDDATNMLSLLSIAREGSCKDPPGLRYVNFESTRSCEYRATNPLLLLKVVSLPPDGIPVGVPVPRDPVKKILLFESISTSAEKSAPDAVMNTEFAVVRPELKRVRPASQ